MKSVIALRYYGVVYAAYVKYCQTLNIVLKEDLVPPQQLIAHVDEDDDDA